MKKLIQKLVKKAKPLFADYRVTVHCGTTGKTLTYYAWTHEEAIEWCGLQCSDDVAVITSSWFGYRVAHCDGAFMKIGA